MLLFSAMTPSTPVASSNRAVKARDTLIDLLGVGRHDEASTLLTCSWELGGSTSAKHLISEGRGARSETNSCCPGTFSGGGEGVSYVV